MSKSAVLFLVLALTISCITMFVPVKAERRTLAVPDEYNTISAAIAVAGDGDTILVKKGIYQEQTLKIDKPLFLVGEDAAETIINLSPPLIETPISESSVQVYSAAISIIASDVKIAGLSINLPDRNGASVDGLFATGDRIEIASNIIGKGCNLNLNGTLISVAENSISSHLKVQGSNQKIEKNLIHALTAQGTRSKIVENTVIDSFNLQGFFNLVVGNSFSAVYLDRSDSNFISNNTLGSLWIGFNGAPCSGNTICKNKVTGPGNWGILMGAGAYNVFHDNLISDYAGGYGIAIGGNDYPAEYNAFYRNILINNSLHVGANWEVLGAGNYWDNGETGNYWDGYIGRDDDGDGIGDTAYVIEGCKWDNATGGLASFIFGQDSYPIMVPFDIENVIITLPEWATSSWSFSPEPAMPEPFPTVPVAVAAIVDTALVGAVLLFHYRKRKRQAVARRD